MPDQNAQEVPATSKMEEVLTKLREAALELAKDNDPSVDATTQNAGRTQMLAKVVASLTTCLASGIGAMGAVIGKFTEEITALKQEIESLKAAPPAETVEVDNTGAPAEPEVVKPKPANGKAKAPAAAAKAPPAAPPASPPVAGMPAEVAQLAQAPSAPIASVVVKP